LKLLKKNLGRFYFHFVIKSSHLNEFFLVLFIIVIYLFIFYAYKHHFDDISFFFFS